MPELENRLQELKLLYFDNFDNDAKLREIEQERKDIMRQIELLKQYDIKQQYDGRFVYNYHKDGKRIKIRKKTKEEVLNEIIRLQNEEKKENAGLTLLSLYPMYRDNMVKTGKGRTAQRNNDLWKKYLENSTLATIDWKTIKMSTLTSALCDIITQNQMTEKQYKNTKSLLNAIIDFAVDDDLLDFNRARNVRCINKDLFREKDETEQVFSESESEDIIHCCLDYFNKTKNPAYLALILNFLLGLRAGELATLKYEDFDFENHILTVSRSEISEREFDGDSFHVKGLKVVNRLKMGYKAREEVIDIESTPCVVKFVWEACGGSEWLFTRPDGERMTSGNIHHALDIVTKKLNIAHRSNHKIRKTVISKMVQSGEFSTTDIAKRAGHRDYSTTQKYYAHLFKDENAEKSVKIGKVLSLKSLAPFGPAV